MTAAVTLPDGTQLAAVDSDGSCRGCWFDLHLGGCIGHLQHQPGCGDLTRTDGRKIIWVQHAHQA